MGYAMKQGATRLRRVPESAEEIAAMPARASADSAAATRAIPVNLMPLIAAYRKRGRFMLRIENLPQGARFSGGQNNGDGSWSLALDELDELVYFAPKNNAGSDHTLSIRLVAKDETEAFTLALIDFPILGPSDRESAGFPKPIDPEPVAGSAARAELQDVQAKLAARERRAQPAARLGRAHGRAVAAETGSRGGGCRSSLETRRGRPHHCREDAAGRSVRAAAERGTESRVQAMADIAREQQSAQMRRLAQELGTAQETLASRDGELAASRAAAGASARRSRK